MDRSAVLAALQAEADNLGGALARLDGPQLDVPTRCVPWLVRDVLAHVLVACDRVPAMLGAEALATADVPAWGYFRRDARFSDRANAERVDAARRRAASFSSGSTLVSAIARAVRRTMDVSAGVAGDRVVRTRWGDAMLLDDFLATRVVELVVHGLDLARALDRPPWTSDQGAAITLAVVLEEPSSSGTTGGAGSDDARTPQAWSVVDLIERATGRVEATEDLRAVAGLRSLAFG